MEGLNEWLKPEIIWFLIGLVLLVLEFSAPGLIIAFFGVGAWVVALVALFIDISLTTQLLIFLITSVLMLIFLRKSLKKVFKLESIEDQNELEDFVGHTAEVILKISPNKPGKVELNGTSWEAESETEIARARARAKIKMMQLRKAKAVKEKKKAEKKKIKGELLASSGTKEGIIKLIADYWFGKPAEYELKKTGDNEYAVYGPRGKKDGVRVIYKEKRYRFEFVPKRNDSE